MEGFDEIKVLPSSRPTASRCPPDICIETVQIPIEANKKTTPKGGFLIGGDGGI